MQKLPLHNERVSTNTPGNTPKEEKKKKPFTLTFRICINTPSGSSSRECCIPAQDCFKGPRLAAVAEPQAPQVGTIEQSKVEKAISIRGSATLWATTEAPAEPEQRLKLLHSIIWFITNAAKWHHFLIMFSNHINSDS